MGYMLNQKYGDVKPISDNNAKMITCQAERVYQSSRKITDSVRSHAWEGKRCFVIGGGASLKGFDFRRLDGDLTIGVNRSFEFYQSTMLYMMDIVFHDMLMRGEISKFSGEDTLRLWREFKGVKTMICPVSPYPLDASIHMIKRIESKFVSLDIADGIYPGSNSGFGALMLAIAMGASPIYLLGFDMKVDKETHWHSGYPRQYMEDQKRKTESFIKIFDEFAPMIKGLGFKVVNLNPDSALKCFEFGEVDRVLHRKTCMCGGMTC